MVIVHVLGRVLTRLVDLISRRKILFTLSIFAITFIVGMVLAHRFEGWSLYESMYWTLITMATIGYGDYVPGTWEGRVLAMVMAIAGITSFTALVSTVIETLLSGSFKRALGLERSKWNKHIVFLGWTQAVEAALSELKLNVPSAKIVIVKPQGVGPIIDEHNIMTIVGDYTSEDVQLQAGVDKAEYIIVSTGDDSKTILSVLVARKLNSKAVIIAEALSHHVEELIRRAGANCVIPTLSFGGRLLASAIFEPGVAVLIEDVSSSALGNDIVEVKTPKELIGKTVEEAMLELKKRFNATLVGLRRGLTTMINPDINVKIESNDHLLLITSIKTLKELK